MKNQSAVQHRMGFNQVFDPISKIYLRLPQHFRIYIRSEKVWIGGKEDGSVYLHIEKIPANALELSRPLADGDLDIQVSARGKGSELEDGIICQNITCVLRGEALDGLWLRVAFNDQFHYLILLAGRNPKQYTELKDAGMELAQMIRDQALDPVTVMDEYMVQV